MRNRRSIFISIPLKSCPTNLDTRKQRLGRLQHFDDAAYSNRPDIQYSSIGSVSQHCTKQQFQQLRSCCINDVEEALGYLPEQHQTAVPTEEALGYLPEQHQAAVPRIATYSVVQERSVGETCCGFSERLGFEPHSELFSLRHLMRPTVDS
ncbi:hypothetical protein RRG08_054960 [Elysia crispata]|uniref:Uncharacterized protein n=1 Tax=Elysia crispata TaxID=231223 RepID=A0AAE1ASK5_9GAST|nr:hypothetical protein RRG08_054960 [Elysia crispata]